MLIDPARAAYDKLQASVREYRKISPHTRDKRYGEGLTFEDFKTRYDARTDFQPIQPLQSASGGLGGGLLGVMKNDGTRVPITKEQLGSGKDTMPFKPSKLKRDPKGLYKPGVLNPQQPGGAGQTLTGQPLVQQVQASLINRMKKSPEYLAWADTVMQTGGYPTEKNPYEMGVNTEKFVPIQGIGSLNQLNVTPPEIPVSMQQPIPGLGAPPQGIGSLTPTPQQPMMPTMPGNTMPENTMGGINSLSEFGKPPSLGGNNSFGNPFMGNTLGGNDNQGMSNYIDNLINQRMKDIFGGIMGIFK